MANEHIAKMRAWGKTAYRNRQAKLRAEGESSKTASAKRIMNNMCPKLGKRVEDFIDYYSNTQATMPLFLTYVCDLCPYEIAVIGMRTFLNNLDRAYSISAMSFRIGKAFENEARWQQAMETFHPNKIDLLKLDDRSKAMKLKQFYDYESVEERFTLWEHKHKTALGAWLLEEIRIHTGLWEVGYRDLMGRGTITHERIVLPTSEFTDWVKRFDEWKESTRTFCMALENKPVDWHLLMGGGYPIEDLPPFNFITGKPRQWFEPYEKSYTHAMSAVNKLQQVPWKINHEMLDVIVKCWEMKRVVGNIPEFGEIDEQPRYTGDCPYELRAWKLKQKDIKTSNVATKSKRYLTCKIIHLAKLYKTYDKLYFPHRSDYRGRLYAIPFFLHPQGSDLAKSLLDFHNGQQVVDEEDFEAVLVHGANTFGVKGTRAELLEWVGKRQKFILEAAENPHGDDWWTEASDPFSFLRFCFEYKKFTEEGYGYMSYLPVRQDCSNNGMQILSLLLRDKDTGKMCNLVEEDRVNDLYQEMADRVYDVLKEDGGPVACEWMRYGFNRKMAKLAIMNRPYGATHYNYVQDLFYSIGVNHPWESTAEQLTACIWLSKIVNKIADEMSEPVKRVMRFLKDSVRALPSDRPVTWTTPTGFKVVQSFREKKQVWVDSVFDNTYIRLKTEDLSDELDKKGQTNAVTANFIHSLDACIVHQVANSVDFDLATIHDCFVTHASNARKIHQIVREMYAKTFTVDLLSEFRAEQINNNPDAELPDVPELGDLDVSAVKRQQYLLS